MMLDYLRMALGAIGGHKARSLLTTLGVVIGVSSVITLLAIGEGLRQDVKATFDEFGSHVLIVLPGDFEAVAGRGNASFNPAAFISGDTLTAVDVEALRALDGVARVVPLSLVPRSVRAHGESSGATVVGGSPEILEVFKGFRVASGRMLQPEDVGRNVVVLGDRPSRQLFDDQDPVGRTVTIGDEEFMVVGRLSRTRATGALTGREVENLSYIPYETATRIVGRPQIHRLIVQVLDEHDPLQVAEVIRADLQSRHQPGDASVLTPDDVLDLLGTLLGRVTVAVSAIAAISLLVGGIGIMNIMLVSVTERTREIGIRMAVGATRSAIMAQFLIEAVLISLLGGALGLLLAWAAVFIMGRQTDLVPVVTPVMILLAAGVSITVGITFGLAPAVAAARKDPIVALRYE